MKPTKTNKKRVNIVLTEYFSDGSIKKTNKKVPARIREAVRVSKASSFGIRIIYKPDVENEFIRDSKQGVFDAMSIFLSKDLLESALRDY